ncbi:related to Osomolarity two-component system protein SSK1 [Zygosaccharomyces bailii ISA1307]|nr:related to Osomolarity two-component system protein SSK1 [Zygosaccharomyces bailii ISA1307]
MSESSTLKLRPTSPLSVNRSVPLNSALSWKIWLKLEDEAEAINQPFSLTFGEFDTVDDLKTKIFDSLNTIRWSRTNDNASIALGFYCDKSAWDPLVTEGFSPIRRLPVSPVDAIFGKGKAVTILQQQGVTARKSLAEGDSKGLSLNTSPRISASTSPKLSAMPRVPSARYGTNSSYLSVQGGNNNARSYGLIPPMSPLPFNGYSWPKKNLKHTIEQINESLFRVMFEPDEVVLNIYNEMFGHMGSQAASEALLVFCSDIVRQPTPLPFTAMSLQTHSKSDLVPESFKSQPQKEEGGEDGQKQVDVFSQPGLETPQQIAILNPEDAPPELLLEHTASQLAREENEREFQLITNEEQLRKVSQSMQDEDNPDSPKQAILLLPKDFDGYVNFNESPSKLSSQPPSPSASNTDASAGTSNVIDHQNFFHTNIENGGGYAQLRPGVQRPRTEDTLMQSHAPLSEKEVGMVHPMLESDRKKGLSSPTSPLLPRNPPPNFNRLSKSFPPKDSPSSEKNFPGDWSATSDKVFPKINVLIVEDNVINQTILSSFLRKHKIFYKVAKNGQEAIDIWKQGNIHLIFMDLQLPVLSGIDAAKKIRELERQHGIGIQKGKKVVSGELKKLNDDQINAPVIIVAFTASKSQSDKREALISGCNDYLTKPVNLHWLSNKINEWGCMQALINFDSWKHGQSRMTDNVLVKAPSHKSVKNSGNADAKSKLNRRSSDTSQSNVKEGSHLAPHPAP